MNRVQSCVVGMALLLGGCSLSTPRPTAFDRVQEVLYTEHKCIPEEAVIYMQNLALMRSRVNLGQVTHLELILPPRIIVESLQLRSGDRQIQELDVMSAHTSKLGPYTRVRIRDVGRYLKAGEPLVVEYLTWGLHWSAEYRVDVLTGDQLRLQLGAMIQNHWYDLASMQVTLVAGWVGVSPEHDRSGYGALRLPGGAEASVGPRLPGGAEASVGPRLPGGAEASVGSRLPGAAVASVGPSQAGAAVASVGPSQAGAAVASVGPGQAGAAIASVGSRLPGAAVPPALQSQAGRQARRVSRLVAWSKAAPSASRYSSTQAFDSSLVSKYRIRKVDNTARHRQSNFQMQFSEYYVQTKAASGRSYAIRNQVDGYHLYRSLRINLSRQAKSYLRMASVKVSSKPYYLWPADRGESVYTVYKVPNQAGILLPAGTAWIYRDGVFVGHDLHHWTPAGGHALLTTTNDGAVTAKKELRILADRSEKLTLTVRSLAKSPIEVEIFESNPLFVQDGRLTHDVPPLTAGERGPYHRWRLELAPGATRTVTLTFTPAPPPKASELPKPPKPPKPPVRPSLSPMDRTPLRRR